MYIKIPYFILSLLIFASPYVVSAASGEDIVDPFAFTNSGGTVLDPFPFTNSGGELIDPFSFGNLGGTVVIPLGSNLLTNSISLQNSNYVRYSDLMELRSTVELFDIQISDLGSISWTSASSGGTLYLAHLQEIRDKFLLIQSSPTVVAQFASGIFLDDNGDPVAAPDFSQNIVFHIGVFENEYRKLLTANNLLVNLSPGSPNLGGELVEPFPFTNSGGTVPTLFPFTNSGGEPVDPFPFINSGGTVPTDFPFTNSGGELVVPMNPVSITFDANGASGSMLTQTGEFGSTITLASNSFTYTGRVFSGWSTTSTGSVIYSNGANYRGASVTLYPVFQYFISNSSALIGGAAVASTTKTISGVPFGTADVNRKVILAIDMGGSTSTYISGVTIGGITATRRAGRTAGDFVQTDIWSANVPTGTSGDVVITTAASSSNGYAIWSYSAYNYSDSNWRGGTNFQASNTSTNLMTTTLSTVASGSIILGNYYGVNIQGTASSVWSGINSFMTIDDVDLTATAVAGDKDRKALGYLENSAGGSVTVSWTSSDTIRRRPSIAVASFY